MSSWPACFKAEGSTYTHGAIELNGIQHRLQLYHPSFITHRLVFLEEFWLHWRTSNVWTRVVSSASIGTRTTTTCVHAQNPHWLSISKYLRYYQFILNYNPKFRSVSTFQCVSQLCRKREWEGGGGGSFVSQKHWTDVFSLSVYDFKILIN